MLENTQARFKERAQQTAEQKKSDAKEEFGRMAFDTLEQYFPNQAETRTREDRVTPLLVGIAIGVLLRHFLGR